VLQSNDTTAGANDKQNDATVTKGGACVGTVYIFNGTDMRCRKSDDSGMITSYLELAAQLVLCATGIGTALGVALAGAMGFEAGTMAMQITVSLTKAVLTTAIDAAIQSGMGQNVSLMQSAISAGISVVGGTIMSGGSGYDPNLGMGDEIAIAIQDNITNPNSSLAWLANNPQYLDYVAQIGNAVQQYAPAVAQAATGQYSTVKCCYPDEISTSCNSSEVSEAKLQQGKLCHVIGTYCASDGWFGCTQTKETSCCFSSKLARIIQEQGRPQLKDFGPTGGWGTPQAPNCQGFTPTQFQALDFSKIDFSEYIADIQAQIQTVTPMLTNYMQGVSDNTSSLLQSLPSTSTATGTPTVGTAQ
jgi:conjugal transfer mating pair stabilization protein TraN